MKENFKKLLLQALRDKNISAHGQGVWLAKQMSVTPKAAGKWLSGDSLPKQERWPELAVVLGKPHSYFYEETKYAFAEALFENNADKAPTASMIPLISWVTAGAWEEPIDNHAVGDAEEWLPCPPNCQAGSTFALNITGDSMDDGSKDGYRDGEIIFVDGSQIEPKHNSDVVVKNGGGKVTFKRLLNSNGTWYLKPLNPDWPDKIIELDEHATLVGRVLFSGKFR